MAFKKGTDRNRPHNPKHNILTYTPEANWHGEDTFTYTVSDNGGLTDTATVTVTVTPVNDPPVITNGIAALSYAENGTGPVASYAASDVESDTLTWSLAGDDAGDFNLSNAGVLTFQSAPDFENPADENTDNAYSLTVQLSDGKNAAGETDATADVTLAVTVTVTDGNDPLIVVDDTATTKEDTAVDISFLANDSDQDAGAEIEFEGMSGASNGSVAVNDDRNVITYTPAPDYHGTDSFFYWASSSDDELNDDDYKRATVTVTVTPVNDAPVITGGKVAVSYSENGTGPVASYAARDQDSGALTWSLAGDDGGDFNISNAGVLTFKEVPDYENPADENTDNVYSLTVQVSDGKNDEGEADATADATLDVTVTVTNANDPPVAAPDTATTAEDTRLEIEVLANDTDQDSRARLQISDYADPENGFVFVRSKVTFIYTPDPDFAGEDTFSYTVSDGLLTATATVTVTVTPVNDAPSITGGSASVAYAENGTGPVQTYTASDPDAGDTLAWSLSGDDASDFNLSDAGVLTFKTAPDYESPADDDRDNAYQVTVTVSDGRLSAARNVTVTVTNVNEQPAAVDDTATTSEDTAVEINAVANDTDPDGDSLTIVSYAYPSNGRLAFKPGGKTVLVYTPNPDFTGKDSFTYVAYDGALTSQSGTVAVTVNPVNDAPVFTGGLTKVIYAENGTGPAQTYSASDAESQSITWSLAGVDRGHFNLSNAGVLSFKTAPDFENPVDGDYNNGDDPDNAYEVTVRVSDGTHTTALAVTVTVTNVNEAPTAKEDAATTLEDTAVEISAVANDTDPEGDSLRVTGWGEPGHGQLELSSDKRSFTYTPEANWHGADTFTYNVLDGFLASPFSTVTVTVTPVNDAPAFTGGLSAVAFDEGGAGTVQTYTAADPDADDSLTWLALSGDDANTFNFNSTTGSLTFKTAPDADDPKDDNKDNDYQVTLGVTDGTLTTTLAVTVTVTNVDERPTANDDTATTAEDTPVEIPVTENDTDPDGDDLVITVMAYDLSYGTFSRKAGDKAIIYTPRPGFTGKAYVTYAVASADNRKLSSNAQVTITVLKANHPPQLKTAYTTRTVSEEHRPEVYFTASDRESDTIVWSLAGDDAGDFNLSNSNNGGRGKLTFKTPPDYENPADSNTDNVYRVKVQVSDGKNILGEADDSVDAFIEIVLTVSNIDETTASVDDSVSTVEDTAVDIRVLDNDTPPDAGAGVLVIRDFRQPSHGSVAYKEDSGRRVLTYTPDADFHGTDSFVYWVEASRLKHRYPPSSTVTVTVTPVNDPPAIGGSANINYFENGTAPVQVYRASDAESQAISWSLEGDDKALFNLNPLVISGETSTGEDSLIKVYLTFKTSPNYESPGDKNTDNVYKVTVRATDGAAATALPVTVTVFNVNEPPTAVEDAVTTAENTPVDISPLDNDTDPDAGTRFDTVHKFNQPANGSVIYKKLKGGTYTPKTLTYSPNANWHGKDTFTYTVSDGVLTATATVTVTVTPVQNPPVLFYTDGLLVQDTTVEPMRELRTYSIGYKVVDPDPEDSHSWSLSGDDTDDFNISNRGSLSFKTPPDYENPADKNSDNTYEVRVTVSDGTASDSVEVSIIIRDSDDPPVAVADSKTTNEDTAVEISVLANDSDQDSSISLRSFTQPANGSVKRKAESLTQEDVDTAFISGDFSKLHKIGADAHILAYTPDKNWHGDDTFTYTISDGNSTATATVTVTVTSVHDTPTIQGPDRLNYTENGTGPVYTYTADAPDATAPLTWSTILSNGGFNINNDGVLTFKSPPNYEDPQDGNKDNVYVVRIYVYDGQQGISHDVYVTVTNADDPPVAVADTVTTDEDTAVAISVLDNDSDEDAGSNLSVSSFFWPPNGATALKKNTNLIVYTPDEDFNGEDTFTYSIVSYRDGTVAASNMATVTVTVNPVNDAPVITGGNASPSYAENGTGPVQTYTVSDPDAGAEHTWSLGGDDASDFNISSEGVLTFKTPPDFENPADEGGDNVYNVTVQVSDGTASGSLDVTVTVTEVNEPPIGGSDSATTPEDTPVDINVLANDSDPEGETLTVHYSNSPNSRPMHGSVAFKEGSNKILTYYPEKDWHGTDSFGYLIYNSRTSGLIRVTVKVTPVNDAPELNGLASVRYIEGAVGPVAIYTVSDPDTGDTHNWSLSGDDAGDFSISSGGELTFRTSPDYHSPADDNEDNTYNVTVTVTEATGSDPLSNSLDVTVEVTDRNNTPVAVNDAKTTVEDTAVDIAVLANDSDPDPETTLAVSGLTQPANGTAALKTGSTTVIVYTPRKDFHGQDTFTYTVSDGVLTATATVTVTVTPANDPAPAVSGDAEVSYAENGTGPVHTYAAADPESDALTWSLAGDDANDFSISGGALTFQSAPDFENPADTGSDNVYNVTVQVSDGKDVAGDADSSTDATLSVTVTVTNVNEPPPAVSGDAAVNYAENGTGPVHTYTATDPESDALTWTLAGDDANDFGISGGALTFQSAPDFENPADEGANNVYNVTVQVSDGKDAAGDADSSADATITVTVNVTDVVEPPGKPAAPTVSGKTATGLTVAWTAPANTGPAITGYAVQYRKGSSGAWSSHAHNGTATNASISGLDAGSSYQVQVRATNGEGTGPWSDSLNASTNEVDNAAPVFSSGAAVNAAENQVVVGTVTAADADSEDSITGYAISGGADSARFTIVASTGALTFQASPDYEDPQDALSATPSNAAGNNEYVVVVTATGGTGARAKSESQTIVVTVTDVNEAPAFGEDSVDIQVAENTAPGTAFGRALSATDPDQTAAFSTLVYSLGGGDALDFAIDEILGQLKVKTALDYETKTSYSVTVAVSDGKDASGSADNSADDTVSVTINVTDVLETGDNVGGGPQLPARPSGLTAAPGNGSVTLSWDNPNDSSITKYHYRQKEGDGEFAKWAKIPRSGADTTSHTITGLQNGTVYKFRVRALSRAGRGPASADVAATPSDMMTISGDAKVSYAENVTGQVAAYTVKDAGGNTVSWSLSGGDAGKFNISGGGLTFRAAPDFENPADTGSDNVYNVTVEASAGIKSASLSVAVTVTNVNEAPALSGAAEVRYKVRYQEEGTGQVAAFSASDPESDALTWSLGGPDAGDFDISSSGVLTFRSAPDFENPVDKQGNNVYKLKVQVSDGKGADGSTDNSVDTVMLVTVRVTDDRLPAQLSGLTATAGDGSITLSWNNPSDNRITKYQYKQGYKGNFQDGKWADIPNSGADTTSYTVPGLENGTAYEFRVRAWNAAGRGPASALVEATPSAEIQRNDQTDQGSGSPQRESEAIISGAPAVGYPENGTGQVADYSAEAPGSETVAWTLGGDDAGKFNISSDGALTFQSTPDYENPADEGTDNIYNVTVEASAGTESDSLDVIVTVTDVNEPPAISGDAQVSYAENGTGPVHTYTAADPESDALTWTLGGDDAGDFNISSDGALTFQSVPDFENPADEGGDNVYNVTVQVSDGKDEAGGTDSSVDATISVTIGVTDVTEDAMTISGAPAVGYPENGTGQVADYSAEAPGSETVAWTLGGDDAGKFNISSDGAQTFQSTPDYENPADEGTDNIYNVTCRGFGRN